MSEMIQSLPMWIGGITPIAIHHIHIIVEDITAIQTAYEGVSGVESMQLHDVRACNGILALMVRTKPFSVEYIQVTDKEIGMARIIKDEPFGLSSFDFLVHDGDAAVKAAKQAGFIVTGEMTIYGCREIWLKHNDLKLSMEFMVMSPADYKVGANPEMDKPKVWIYGLDGTENLYFE